MLSPGTIPDTTGRPRPALNLRGITKAFGPTVVLRGVDFDVCPGEIHALMGENGAGKSTLVKIAAGLIPDYGGTLEVDSVPRAFLSPRDATRAGIAMIHQELSLVPELAVDENVFLGQEKVRALCLVDRQRQRRAAQDVLRPLDFQARFDVPVSKLRIGEQQLVEIAKALAARARILIMDEPTSALSVHEAERLFDVIRRLAKDGVAIVYISHRMEEVFALAHRVTVLRDGKHVGTLPAAQANRREIIRLMVGRELQEWFVGGKGLAPAADRRPALEAANLRLPQPHPFAESTRPPHRRELCGAPGRGFRFGRPARGGSHRNARNDLRPARPDRLRPRQSERGTAAVPVRAGRQGGRPRVRDRGPQTRRPLAQRRPGSQRRADGHALARRLRRRAGSPRTPQRGTRHHRPGHPSLWAETNGRHVKRGNQQKLVIGKWLLTKPCVILLDEPTRGIDVGAKADVYRLIERLAEAGMALSLVSSELPELTFLSHRILVLREGRPTALLEKADFVPEKILEYASPGGEVQPAFAREATAA